MLDINKQQLGSVFKNYSVISHADTFVEGFGNNIRLNASDLALLHLPPNKNVCTLTHS